MKALMVLICSLFVYTTAFSQEMPGRKLEKDTIAIAHRLRAFTPFISNPVRNEQAIPRNFYTQHLGFFCRQELKMQEVHVPVTFRLGSMDYCNWLEQKPGYR